MKNFGRRAGNSIIEIVVTVSIFGILAVALISIVLSGIHTVSENESRVTALGIANERIEIIKNLSYDDVGTIGGIPSGTLLQSEDYERNNRTFTVETDIRYVDDAYDGILPTDTLNTDYKQVTITVNWNDPISDRPVILSTTIVPNGIETNDSGGTLWIEVFDPSTDPLTPVSNATISIQAPSVNPPVSITSKTDTDGRYILPGAPIGVEAYEVTVSKSGYNSTQTYSTDPVTNPTPDPAHLNVLAGEITTEYFQLSQLVDALTIEFIDRDTQQPIVTNFSMHGEKTIGTTGEGFPIYKFNNQYTSDAAGTVNLQNIEADIYSIDYNEQTENYVIAGYSSPLPIIALSNTINTVTFQLVPYEQFTLLLNVADSTGTIIPNATVHLYTALGYDTTQTTDAYGQSFFADLLPQSYTVDITAEGYLPFTGAVTVNGNENQTLTLGTNE